MFPSFRTHKCNPFAGKYDKLYRACVAAALDLVVVWTSGPPGLATGYWLPHCRYCLHPHLIINTGNLATFTVWTPAVLTILDTGDSAGVEFVKKCPKLKVKVKGGTKINDE